MQNRKGIMLSQAFGAVLTLVLISVLVIIGIYLMSNLKTGFPYVTATVTNESGWLNSTGYTLTNVTACRGTSPVITALYNSSDSAVISLANATTNTTTWVVTNATSYSRNAVKISYTYQWGDDACTATNNTITQFSNYPALIGLIGVIIFLGIIIGVLVGSFAFGGRKGM